MFQILFSNITVNQFLFAFHSSKEGNDDRKTDLDREAEEKAKPKLKVTMVTWNIDDSLIITAINDYSLKVWCGFTGKLKHILMVSGFFYFHKKVQASFEYIFGYHGDMEY